MARSELNPIPFNPEGLTIRQMKDAADTLSMIFEGIERVENDGVPAENLIHNMKAWRDSLSAQWKKNS
jgi:hypothetical protein